MGNRRTMNYNGTFYEPIGDFLREKYDDYGFSKGTKQEVDFILNLLDLSEGSRILDVGCGPGRHSLELARRGYFATGVDISSGFIEVARERASKEGLKDAVFAVADARNMTFDHPFDSAICLCEGAFGLAGDLEGHREVLQRVYEALKAGGIFILTVIHALHVASNLKPPSEFDAYTSTSVYREAITNPNGEHREVDIYTTAFTYREMQLLLEGAGFDMVDAYGCMAGRFEKKPLSVEDLEIMVVARRK